MPEAEGGQHCRGTASILGRSGQLAEGGIVLAMQFRARRHVGRGRGQSFHFCGEGWDVAFGAGDE